MAQAELLLDAKAALGEGPSWDERNGLLYWVDIDGKALHTYEVSSKQTSVVPLGKKIGAVVPRKSGGVVLVLEDGFYAYDPSGDGLTFLGNPEGRKPNTRFNDGKCDAAGRFWAGTMSMNGTANQGALYCLETDLTIRTIFENVSCSNGLAWSPDNRTMYYIDSPTRKVMAYDFDLESGEMSNPRVAVEVTEEGAVPDGMTSDAEGMIWVALWGGYGIRRWNPHTGELLLKIDVPAEQSSSCAFAGPNLDELYITSARVGISEANLLDQPLAGGLFLYKSDVKGQPTYAFGG
ncbi:SMP-30/gluconolactonase/LRE family protein [Paenibacillus hemerocallicola]|uniref:SMP-30/gluconolactonase/LRE family protein n=2 Tax=Paenibacillus hemerocallicola TaxID=1172614 RepID=A0A5C4T385_9BACL|nr:SMP-30/gluconolactonase/LRE family protein [Paenibacillus hemerocallicola]